MNSGRRRLRVGEERKIETLESFFKWFGTKRTGQALHVLDRSHVAGKLGDDRQGVRSRGPRVESAMQAAAPHAQPPAAAKAPRARLPTSGTRRCREGPTRSPSCARGRPAHLPRATPSV